MVTYPVRVKRNNYRGNDARKKSVAAQENRDAYQIEQTANRLIQAQVQDIKVYLWMEISRESDVDFETVRRLGFSIDCGSNGFTATRPGYVME